MLEWRKEVLKKSKEFLDLWAEQQGVSKLDIEKATLYQELIIYKTEKQNINQEIENCKQELDEILDKSVEIDYYLKNKHQFDRKQQKEAESTIQRISDLTAKKKEIDNERKEIEKQLQTLVKGSTKQIQKLSLEELNAKIKELFDTNNKDSDKLQKMLSVQAEWIEQFGRSELFNAALIKRAQVIAGTCIGIPAYIQDIEFDLCIIDEASKANATEVLVPMALAKKWILVGDPKQLPPFLDEIGQNKQFLDDCHLSLDDVKRTLFDHLSTALPKQNRKMLSVQHRMIKAIGDMVSHCFYDRELKTDNNLTHELSDVFPKAVTWFSTSSRSNKKEQEPAPHQYINNCEEVIILELLRKLNLIAETKQRKYGVAVLTGYAAQLKKLNRMKNSHSHELNSLNIECNTVDAFQGREADITIYSITRSNNQGKTGFLRDERRLNVAFSRSKLALAIVGDHEFCAKSESKIREVISYIDNHPQDCCRKEI
jgi:superfamily I DNA and/or RNA helicase